MRILWASNFSAQSAYAQQSRLFCDHIRRMSGHEIHVFELSSGVSRPYEWRGIPIIGIGQDSLGNDMIQYYVKQLEIDAVITLVDVWRFQPEVWKEIPFYPWCPVDHLPVPPGVQGVLEGAAHRVIAMSKFGLEQLTNAGHDTLYVPLAYDPEIFHPRTDTRRGEVRKALNIPDDTFVASFTGVNDSTPNRKGIPEMLMAWKLFVEKHPNSILYMHTLMHGNLPMNSIGGVRIDRIVNGLGLDGNKHLRMVDQNRYKSGVIAQSEVADIMAAADVQLLASRGEGFGVPLIEAQACGTPVMTTNFAAAAELVFAGWHVDYETEWSWQDAWSAKAGVIDMVEKLEMAYAMRGNADLRQMAAVGAQPYAIENVMRAHMLPTLDTLIESAFEKAIAV